MMRLGSLTVAGLVLVGGTAWAATGDALVVTGNGVNVRAGPGTDAQVLMQVHRNQQVIELERQGAWVRAEIAGTDGREGWIHGSLLAPPEGEAPAAEPQAEATSAALESAVGPTSTADQPTAAPLGEGAAAMPEPAAGPAAGELSGLEQFRESVDYLNQRAQDLAGVDLFSDVEPAGEGVVQVVAAEGWSTVTEAGQQSFLNTLQARWAAARGGDEPASVQIVDASGRVVMETSGR